MIQWMPTGTKDDICLTSDCIYVDPDLKNPAKESSEQKSNFALPIEICLIIIIN